MTTLQRQDSGTHITAAAYGPHHQGDVRPYTYMPIKRHNLAVQLVYYEASTWPATRSWTPAVQHISARACRSTSLPTSRSEWMLP